LKVGELALAIRAAAVAVQVATAGCSEAEQELIACEAARKLHSEAAEGGTREAVVTIASAAITALRPGQHQNFSYIYFN